MATIRKRTNRKGTVWQIDYYDPQGKRVMKCFPLKKDAEAYLGKVQAAKKEGRYHDVFDVKKETQVTFNELADRYVENFRSQKCFSRLQMLSGGRIPGEPLGTGGFRKSLILTWKPTATGARQPPPGQGNPGPMPRVNREMSTLRHMLNKAVEWGMLENIPFNKGSTGSCSRRITTG